MHRILTICGDPGGAAAIAPVIRLLNTKEGIELINVAYHKASAVLETNRIAHVQADSGWTSDAVTSLFEKTQPDALLSATSCNDQNLEHLFLREARNRNIYSLAVLDFWSNYKQRFEFDGDKYYFPDEIAVMDDFAKQEMIEEGFAGDSLIVTGQPALDSLQESRLTDTAAKRSSWCRQLGIDSSSMVVGFISQPSVGEYLASSEQEFSKHTILPLLVKSLVTLSKKYSEIITLVIRPHPRESEDSFSWIKETEGVRTLVDREATGR
ncbi:MAG: hypothetical protein ABI615_14385, partial [Chthoniobacterales bacterium]